VAETSHHDKTEAPTQRRRERAREEGHVAQSPDLTNALVMFLVALALRRAGPILGAGLEGVLHQTLPRLNHATLGVAETAVWGRWLGSNLLWLTCGLWAATAAIGLLATGVQVGVRMNPGALALKWERLSPTSGWQKLFSLDGAMRGFGACMKAVLVGSLTVMVLSNRWEEVRRAPMASLSGAVAIGWDVIASAAIAISLGTLAWAAADYFYRWWRQEQDLKMSRQELADEIKQDEGHPQLRARMRKLQRDAATRKSLKTVPEATIVLTNPTHLAVALQYRLGYAEAPRVLAKGKGALAKRIVRIARQHGIPVEEAKPVARALYKYVPVGHEIPTNLYHIVAEVLARLYQRKRAG
jgi:flagellar biosynthetic protein FlhB